MVSFSFHRIWDKGGCCCAASTRPWSTRTIRSRPTKACRPSAGRTAIERHPESASYSPEFLQRYRVAQRERVARIDAYARKCLAAKSEARKRLKESPRVMTRSLPLIRRSSRCGGLVPTRAASTSRWSRPIAPTARCGVRTRPRRTTVALGSRGCVLRRAGFRTGRRFSSNASIEKRAPRDIVLPTLMIEYTGDNSVVPE